MRWIRFEAPDASGPAFGSLDPDGETIREIEGELFGERRPTGRSVRTADVQLLAPIVPPTFSAAGVNYPTHFRAAAERAGKPVVDRSASTSGTGRTTR